MTHWRRSSSVSGNCRLEWRPSRWLRAALILLGVLGACAAWASEMPRWAAWPLACACVSYGSWLSRREQRKPVRLLVFPGGPAPPRVDGEAVSDLTIVWRGPLAFVHWRDAERRRQVLGWWPDTLPPERRRELRLAAEAHAASRRHPPMAP